LSPKQAVIWAAFFILWRFFYFIPLWRNIGKGMIDIKTVTPTVILAGLGALFHGI